MENPHQKKYKTQSLAQKAKQKGSKQPAKNNWSLYQHKFPAYKSVSGWTRKDKRHIAPPPAPPTAPPPAPPPALPRREELGDPWAGVNIDTAASAPLGFGLYDELGRKVHRSLQDRVMVEDGVRDYEDGYRGNREKQEDVFLNITIDLDQVPEVEQKYNSSDNIHDNNVLLDQVSRKFSEKLEVLYEKLAALKNLEAKMSRPSSPPVPVLPPFGHVGLLKKPVAVRMRQDAPLYTSALFKPASLHHNLVQQQQQQQQQHAAAFKQYQSEYREANTAREHGVKGNKSMLNILKRQLEQLIPPRKFPSFLEKQSSVSAAPPLPTLPPVFVPPPSHAPSLVSPPWRHDGVPAKVQHNIKLQKKLKSKQGNNKHEKSIFSLLLPNISF